MRTAAGRGWCVCVCVCVCSFRQDGLGCLPKKVTTEERLEIAGDTKCAEIKRGEFQEEMTVCAKVLRQELEQQRNSKERSVAGPERVRERVARGEVRKARGWVADWAESWGHDVDFGLDSRTRAD